MENIFIKNPIIVNVLDVESFGISQDKKHLLTKLNASCVDQHR